MRYILFIIFSIMHFFTFSQGIMLGVDSGGFSPSDVSDLKAWYVASDMDGNGIDNEESSGTAATTWVDKSLSGFDLTISGDPQMQIADLNGMNTIEFDALDDYYICSGCAAGDFNFLHTTGSTSTIFYVAYVDPSEGSRCVLLATCSTSSTDEGFILQFTNSTLSPDRIGARISDGDGNSNYVYDVGMPIGGVSNSWPQGSWDYWTIKVDPNNATVDNRIIFARGSGSDFTIGNTENDSPSSGNHNDPFQIGSMGGKVVDPWNGRVAEVIMYDRTLNSSEISNVKTYLANKYGL